MNSIEENLEKTKQPDFLYKYYTFNENSFKVLINKEIWVSTFDKFNDPFEGLYKIKTNSNEISLMKSSQFFFKKSLVSDKNKK
jgi:hypothetical protein